MNVFSECKVACIFIIPPLSSWGHVLELLAQNEQVFLSGADLVPLLDVLEHNCTS